MVDNMILKAVWSLRFPLLCCLFGATLFFGYKYIAKISLDLKETTATMEQYKMQSENLAKEMFVREQVRLAREEESNKRWSAIQRRLDNAEAKEWAATPLPASLRGLSVVLQAVPEQNTGSPANPKTNPGR